MRTDNIKMLEHTLSICKAGQYTVNGEIVRLALSPGEMKVVRVFLPDELERLKAFRDFQHIHVMGRCGYSCENMDSFTLARKRYGIKSYVDKPEKEILVLNFANPVHPGGGVRGGAQAQEEDLCRKSSLLLSLESDAAGEYYRYNRSLNTDMGSNAIIITPKVEIIKDEAGQLLDKPVVVAVMTCAAPMVNGGYEGMTQAQYETLLYERICGMLRCAAYLGYKRLVLGAFGCGAFGNDAHLVSDLFYKALKASDFDGMKESDLFQSIDFAVLSGSRNLYNYNEFYRNFGGDHFYRDQDEQQRQRALARVHDKEIYLDAIRGSLVGGAIGDALGYPVEFLDLNAIVEKYGEKGITAYEYDKTTGKALISDDTQMTLFTANGILVGATRLSLRGIGGTPRIYVPHSYQDWLTTQQTDYQTGRHTRRSNGFGGSSWLLDVPELYNKRAPGNTCLSALKQARQALKYEQEIPRAQNQSKGCGGLMRIAPLGIHYNDVPIEVLDEEGAALAALTHGHPLGYMPAAVLTHILNRLVYRQKPALTLKEIIRQAQCTVGKIYAAESCWPALSQIIDLAVSLAENKDTDRDNIKRLGQGWVAEEALGIALYCALRYEHDFTGGVIAAVNHDGDSDSTGAITGNILGAINGYERIEEKWNSNLELLDVLLEMADDLCYGCIMSEYDSYRDEDWIRKYIHMHWKDERPGVVFFWHEYEEHGCFSNWYAAPFVVDDFCYRHVEQYLMAQKAKLFHDARQYTAILRADTPNECKLLGKKVKPFDVDKWKAARCNILKTALRAKFTQNPELKKELLATGDCLLAEASPYDGIYGIKLTAAEAADLAPEQWPGQNLLGKALMEIRDELWNQ